MLANEKTTNTTNNYHGVETMVKLTTYQRMEVIEVNQTNLMRTLMKIEKKVDEIASIHTDVSAIKGSIEKWLKQ